MEIIAHRRNTVADLAGTPTAHGVEIDLRTWDGQLVLNHEPFEPGERFSKWLDAYAHGTLIVNVKEDGLEEPILAVLADRGIDDFFFLDQPFPALLKCARGGESRCAVRVSEFEAVDTAIGLAGLVDWVWIDCFTRFPMDAVTIDGLHDLGFRTCVVSPELQGRSSPQTIHRFRAELEQRGVAPTAVCTKRADLWDLVNG